MWLKVQTEGSCFWDKASCTTGQYSLWICYVSYVSLSFILIYTFPKHISCRLSELFQNSCCFRTEDAEAFEVQNGGRSTGIFTKYLNKHILQPLKVTQILELVSEGEFWKNCEMFYFRQLLPLFMLYSYYVARYQFFRQNISDCKYFYCYGRRVIFTHLRFLPHTVSSGKAG